MASPRAHKHVPAHRLPHLRMRASDPSLLSAADRTQFGQGERRKVPVSRPTSVRGEFKAGRGRSETPGECPPRVPRAETNAFSFPFRLSPSFPPHRDGEEEEGGQAGGQEVRWRQSPRPTLAGWGRRRLWRRGGGGEQVRVSPGPLSSSLYERIHLRKPGAFVQFQVGWPGPGASSPSKVAVCKSAPAGTCKVRARSSSP